MWDVPSWVKKYFLILQGKFLNNDGEHLALTIDRHAYSYWIKRFSQLPENLNFKKSKVYVK
jgi:hypothetical protein